MNRPYEHAQIQMTPSSKANQAKVNRVPYFTLVCNFRGSGNDVFSAWSLGPDYAELEQ
jgi:hypothetical protein